MRTPRRPLISAPIAVVTGFVVSAAVGLASPPAQDAPGNTAARPGAATWITAWGTSQQALADVAITNATVRMIARVTIPGENIRIRLDNAFGSEPVTFGRVYVGYRVQGALVAADELVIPGPPGPVRFGDVQLLAGNGLQHRLQPRRFGIDPAVADRLAAHVGLIDGRHLRRRQGRGLRRAGRGSSATSKRS